ncbi:dGTPase, partial [Helicobacter pylori]|nr:dGTPase [Helicobacter pylori]
FFFLLKCTRKIRSRHAKMKDIYLDVKASIENLQNIFKNTDNENERLKNPTKKRWRCFKN